MDKVLSNKSSYLYEDDTEDITAYGEDFVSDVSKRIEFVQKLARNDGPLQSPVNLQIRYASNIDLPPLKWHNYDIKPKKMKITNTGHTVVLSGRWSQDRPLIEGGSLSGSYVFSHIHFHWGKTNDSGSDHQIEGRNLPMEMHVVHFKSSYNTQESALREKDGLLVLVYFLKMRTESNENLEPIISMFHKIQKAQMSTQVEAKELTRFIKIFEGDYLLYWGSENTSSCKHIIQWFICREPFNISKKQIEMFRQIRGTTNTPLLTNNRDVKPMQGRMLFHVLPSEKKDSVLLN